MEESVKSTISVKSEIIESILHRYHIDAPVKEQKTYLHHFKEHRWLKLIFGVTLEDGHMLVVKFLREDGEDPFEKELQKVENQSIFSEFMRSQGIRTPKRYQAEGRHATALTYCELPCAVTVEDWCGEEITEISVDIARRIGALMGRMHTLSLAHHCEIGHTTLFSAAYENDVDVFREFCDITQDEHLDQAVVAQIKAIREEKLKVMRAAWPALPKAAVQGDISINNLVDTDDGLIVFDYNNAGDEVLVSDLVLEGLLTAYEMDLPAGVPASYCDEQLFPAFLEGYLSVRQLSEAESAVAWEIYTLYHALWFSKIRYRPTSLESLVKNGDYDAANQLLKTMLADIAESDDGRFFARR